MIKQLRKKILSHGPFQSGKTPVLALGLLFPLLFFVLHRLSVVQLGDTDRFFHFALAREMAAQSTWALRSLPQLPALGWGDYFPDKEFLFHVLTALGYQLHDERGAELAVLACAAAGALVLYRIALYELPALAAFGLAFAACFAHPFFYRLLYLRPHVLAILCFLLLQLSVLRRKPWLAAAACAGYALSYHALYVPALSLFLAAGIGLWESRQERAELFRLAGYGALGLVLGVVVNPFFPSNLTSGLIHASIPFLMHSRLYGIGFGSELFPVSSGRFLWYYWLPLLSASAALVPLLRPSGTGSRFPLRYAFALTLVWLGFTSRTIRGGEYLFPACGLLLVALFAQVPEARRVWAALAIALLQALVFGWVFWHGARINPDEPESSATWAALARIPAGEHGTVFNCEWDRGAFILYARPDLRFVNVLDPSFLYFYNPPLFEQERRLMRGEGDLHAILSGDFHADFVLCASGPLTERLARDPGFQRLYPLESDRALRPLQAGFELFQLGKSLP